MCTILHPGSSSREISHRLALATLPLPTYCAAFQAVKASISCQYLCIWRRKSPKHCHPALKAITTTTNLTTQHKPHTRVQSGTHCSNAALPRPPSGAGDRGRVCRVCRRRRRHSQRTPGLPPTHRCGASPPSPHALRVAACGTGRGACGGGGARCAHYKLRGRRVLR